MEKFNQEIPRIGMAAPGPMLLGTKLQNRIKAVYGVLQGWKQKESLNDDDFLLRF